jgi:hypothetical protein
MFCTVSANIFINPCPACCDTEKGGEGARDRRVGDVLSCAYSLRQPASPACQTGGRRCSGGPPPITHTPFQQFEAIAVDLYDSV